MPPNPKALDAVVRQFCLLNGIALDRIITNDGATCRFVVERVDVGGGKQLFHARAYALRLTISFDSGIPADELIKLAEEHNIGLTE